MRQLIDKLAKTHRLSLVEYEQLICGQTDACAAHAARLAGIVRRRYYKRNIYIRGLIEVGNVCHNDCFYCGIRKSNQNCVRYVLDQDQVLSCCAEGYALGFRTFVLQGGEQVMPVNRICTMIAAIRETYPDCAITLSFGEYTYEEYRQMYDAGANRYLLRHETADAVHYRMLHPPEMSFMHRIRCLHALREIGFQVGCGFMVGSPYQTVQTLARDLKFIEDFRPDMCGIGPFMPQADTPFGTFPAGSAEQTVYLLSLIRLIHPKILLPATTALGSICKDGREHGILAGANVIMPNLSPPAAREKYTLYDNKLVSGEESAQNLEQLKCSMRKIGYTIVTDRGDVRK